MKFRPVSIDYAFDAASRQVKRSKKLLPTLLVSRMEGGNNVAADDLNHPQFLEADFANLDCTMSCYSHKNDSSLPLSNPDPLRHNSSKTSEITSIVKHFRLQTYDSTLALQTLWFIYLSRFRLLLSQFQHCNAFENDKDTNLITAGKFKISKQAMSQFLHVVEIIGKNIFQGSLVCVNHCEVKNNPKENLVKDAHEKCGLTRKHCKIISQFNHLACDPTPAIEKKRKIETACRSFASTSKLYGFAKNESHEEKSRCKVSDIENIRKDSTARAQKTLEDQYLPVAVKNHPKNTDNSATQEINFAIEADNGTISHSKKRFDSISNNAAQYPMTEDLAENEDNMATTTYMQSHKALCFNRSCDSSGQFTHEVTAIQPVKSSAFDSNTKLNKKKEDKKPDMDTKLLDKVMACSKTQSSKSLFLNKTKDYNNQTLSGNGDRKANEPGFLPSEISNTIEPTVQAAPKDQTVDLTRHKKRRKKKREKKRRKKADKRNRISKKRKEEKLNDFSDESKLVPYQPLLSKVTPDFTRQKSETFHRSVNRYSSSMEGEHTAFDRDDEGGKIVVRNSHKDQRFKLSRNPLSNTHPEVALKSRKLQNLGPTENFKERTVHEQAQTNTVAQVLCSEFFINGSPKIVQALRSGTWAEDSLYDAYETDLTPFPQIILHNTALLDDIGVDIEIIGRIASIVRNLSTFGGEKNLTQSMRSLIKLIALGRYRKIHFFLNIDCEISESIARDIAFLQSAPLGNTDCVVLFEMMSGKSLPTAISRICLLGTTCVETAMKESYSESLGDDHFVERARFLLQLLSSLTVYDTFRFLERSEKGMASYSLHNVFNSNLRKKDEDTTHIQLKSAAFASLESYDINIR